MVNGEAGSSCLKSDLFPSSYFLSQTVSLMRLLPIVSHRLPCETLKWSKQLWIQRSGNAMVKNLGNFQKVEWRSCEGCEHPSRPTMETQMSRKCVWIVVSSLEGRQRRVDEDGKEANAEMAHGFSWHFILQTKPSYFHSPIPSYCFMISPEVISKQQPQLSQFSWLRLHTWLCRNGLRSNGLCEWVYRNWVVLILH